MKKLGIFILIILLGALVACAPSSSETRNEDFRLTISVDKTRANMKDIIEMTAAAQVLHSFYNGVESIIILFFKHMNENFPNNSRWHKTVFEMAFGINSRNIKIIRDDVKIMLEKYLLFRHFIRHSYSSELDWNEMEPLIREIKNIWEIIKTDFKVFTASSSS